MGRSGGNSIADRERKCAEGGGTCGRGIAGDGRKPCSITADREKGLVLEEGAFFSHIMLLPETAIESHFSCQTGETRRIQILMKAEWGKKVRSPDQMQSQIDNGDGFYDGS